MRTLLFSLAILAASPALAGDAQRIEIPAVQEVDFETLDINGTLYRPAGILTIERRRASFHPLIQLRVSFQTEMASSLSGL